MNIRIVRGDADIPSELRGAAVALGVMDGVHLGHQAVLADARAVAQARGAPLAAAVFEPHPRHFFEPDAPPFRLQSAPQRARAFEALDADLVVELTFDRALALLTHEDFSRTLLRDRLGAAHVSIGFDFHYGLKRAGDTRTLAAEGAGLGFSVGITPALLQDGVKISSTAIRAHVAAGEMERAAAMLSRPWAIEGVVIEGAKRGRTIGFPTANIALGGYQQPRFGVYAVEAHIAGRRVSGVANCGVKPTVGAEAPLLETHFFDFERDLYGRTLEISLLRFLRPERKFESFDALKAQILHDAAEARAYLAR